ncbi:unnamed protein product [Mytilus coruscus]|uniref:Uncharacterized protein n=1 Tax=Mytilus coruscus TaxID=42192 RepID=A0A6J8DVB8_MYTCO|nr:unnamed protein product [Mytilus coruscus]
MLCYIGICLIVSVLLTTVNGAMDVEAQMTSEDRASALAAQRTVTKVLWFNNGGSWGTWSSPEFCAKGYYASGFSLKIHWSVITGSKNSKETSFSMELSGFLQHIADLDAVRRLQSGLFVIEEEEVETKLENLLSHADILLCPETQTSAKMYFSKDAWQLVLNTQSIRRYTNLTSLNIKNRTLTSSFGTDASNNIKKGIFKWLKIY